MKTKFYKNIFTYIILLFWAIICLFPLYWMFRSSFLDNIDIFAVPIIWWPKTFRFQTYVEAVNFVPFFHYMGNTVIIVLINITAVLFSSSLAAFGFSRVKFKGQNFCFALVLGTMMLPTSVLLVPMFLTWKDLGFYNTWIPLVAQNFFINGFFIFLLRQFFMGIPRSLDEAAYIDGAGYFTVYSQIIVPLAKPSMASVAVFCFMNKWNEFLEPLIYLKDMDKYTVSLGLKSFISEFFTEWTYLMAASVLSILPLLVIFFIGQKHFIGGVSTGAIKG